MFLEKKFKTLILDFIHNAKNQNSKLQKQQNDLQFVNHELRKFSHISDYTENVIIVYTAEGVIGFIGPNFFSAKFSIFLYLYTTNIIQNPIKTEIQYSLLIKVVMSYL